MSFSENIQKLRKAYGISQEQFASQLNVSRQAVSKWESGNGYPEMEKLLLICDLYQCTLDSLVKGEIEFIDTENNELDIKVEYETLSHRYALLEAIGLDAILIGVILLLSANDLSLLFHISEDLSFGIGITLLLIFVAISIGIFSYASYLMNEFKALYPQLDNFYDENEITQAQKMSSIFTSIGTVIILIGTAFFMLMSILFENLTFPITILLFFTTIALHLFIYFGTLKERTNIEKYNQKKKF